MSELSRRALLVNAAGLGAAFAVGACATTTTPIQTAQVLPAREPVSVGFGGEPSYALMYGPAPTEPFPIAAVDLTRIDPIYLRKEVDYATPEPPGTIVVDPHSRFLYHVHPGGRATRYGVGVGRQGFAWSGVATINSKQMWPDWYPPKEMIEREADLDAKLTDLQSGRGMPGGPNNPLGARALYLWQNNQDTLYRIHGTMQPWTIGTSVSSGCIRMINQDVIHLYDRTPVGTKVVVVGPAAVG